MSNTILEHPTLRTARRAATQEAENDLAACLSELNGALALFAHCTRRVSFEVAPADRPHVLKRLAPLFPETVRALGSAERLLAELAEEARR